VSPSSDEPSRSQAPKLLPMVQVRPLQIGDRLSLSSMLEEAGLRGLGQRLPGVA